MKKYIEVNGLMKEGKYQEALDILHSIWFVDENDKKIVKCNQELESLAETASNQAKEFMNTGEYAEALEILLPYASFSSCIELYATSEVQLISKANTGDVVTYGFYEQDNDKYQHVEPIEWYVLSNENGEVVLCSKYCLEYRSFNDEKNEKDKSSSSYTGYVASFSYSTLKKWLNGDFYNNSFSEAEKNNIAPLYLTYNYELTEKKERIYYPYGSTSLTDNMYSYYLPTVTYHADVFDGNVGILSVNLFQKFRSLLADIENTQACLEDYSDSLNFWLLDYKKLIYESRNYNSSSFMSPSYVKNYSIEFATFESGEYSITYHNVNEIKGVRPVICIKY